MGQTSPINGMWEMARSGAGKAPNAPDTLPVDEEKVEQEKKRIRSKIDHMSIGDRAVYDEKTVPAGR